MTDAFKLVKLSVKELHSLSDTAIRKRVSRFFGTYRMRQAMAAIKDRKGENGQEELDKWTERRKESTAHELDPELSQIKNKVKKVVEESENSTATPEEVEPIINKIISKKRLSEIEKEAAKIEANTTNDKQKWLASLQVSEKPSALTIYGTGQFLTYIAVKEIFDRQAAIRSDHIGVLEKNGSALTPNIISALKTAAAMIIPYAPAPSEADRREMSKAAVLLGLMPENIQENPDDYTAPPPVIIDIEKE